MTSVNEQGSLDCITIVQVSDGDPLWRCTCSSFCLLSPAWENTEPRRLLAPAVGSPIKECPGQVSRPRCRPVCRGCFRTALRGSSEHTVPRRAPTCCNWIRCSPVSHGLAVLTLPSPPPIVSGGLSDMFYEHATRAGIHF